MNKTVRRLLANSFAWAVFSDGPTLGAGFLVVLWFRPEWCGGEPLHPVAALVAVLTAMGGGPSAERSLRNIALFTAVAATTVALAIAAAALTTGCAGLTAWLGWHPAVTQGIIVIAVAVAGHVAYHWAALRLGMDPAEPPAGGPQA